MGSSAARSPCSDDELLTTGATWVSAPAWFSRFVAIPSPERYPSFRKA